jgi:hypothetical protein
VSRKEFIQCGEVDVVKYIKMRSGIHIYTVKERNKRTERLGRAVSTPASYSGGPGFKSRPGDRLF